MVKEYSVAKDGNKRIQPNFKVKEFACKDGTDKVLIDYTMTEILQQIRDCTASTSIHISSGYRTEAYNLKIGGSPTSKHCYGLAADFTCKKGLNTIESKKIACIAEILGASGIEMISSTYMHIDTRSGNKWFSIQYQENGKRKYKTLQQLGFNSWFGYTGYKLNNLGIINPFVKPTTTTKRGDKGNDVKWVQYQLILSGVMPLLNGSGMCNIDGMFGAGTESFVKEFQKMKNLVQDGKVGGATRKALEQYH